MVEHGDEVVDFTQFENIGSVRLEKYRDDKYDIQVSVGYHPVNSEDLVLTTSTESFGVIVISPGDIQLIKEDIERLEDQDLEENIGPDIMCRFCGEDDNGALVSCLYTVAHMTCLEELSDGIDELLEQNKELVTSSTI